MKKRYLPKLGERFNKWVVIDNTIHTNKSNQSCVTCQCECGTIRSVRVTKLVHNESTGCRCVLRKIQHAKAESNAVGLISLSQYTKWRSNAISRNLEWNLTQEYLWELFNKQGGCCALTGTPFVLSIRSKDSRSINTVSIDRIDSSIGYVKNNIQLVLKHVNFMKHTLGQEDFIKLCNLVAKKFPMLH